MPQVQQRETRQRPVKPTQPRHCLEALAHFARHHQLPRLIGKARKVILIAACSKPHFLIDAQARQKMHLGGKPRELKAAVSGRLGHARKVHPGADVLQSDVRKRILAEAMPEVAHQGAVAPLGQIVLRTR